MAKSSLQYYGDCLEMPPLKTKSPGNYQGLLVDRETPNPFKPEAPETCWSIGLTPDPCP